MRSGPRSQSPSLRGSGRFFAVWRAQREAAARLNPLHCGAVVASRRAHDARRVRRLVSIPFIAGQWSLPPRRMAEGQGVGSSQSPSLRGSGRFQDYAPGGGGWMRRLNPLHCGAVVASDHRAGAARRDSCLNPLHCGAVVASEEGPPGSPPATSLNPLHCGAVVASSIRSLRRCAARCLNPLHCGAVVAS